MNSFLKNKILIATILVILLIIGWFWVKGKKNLEVRVDKESARQEEIKKENFRIPETLKDRKIETERGRKLDFKL